MDIHKSMLSENYKEYIDKAFINITGKTFNIEYFTEDELQETKENKPNKEVTEDFNEEWVTNLNPKFTFDSFIVGASNDLAFAAAPGHRGHPHRMELRALGPTGRGRLRLPRPGRGSFRPLSPGRVQPRRGTGAFVRPGPKRP